MWPPKLSEKLMVLYEQQLRYEVKDKSGKFHQRIKQIACAINWNRTSARENFGTNFEKFHLLRHKLISVQVINFGTRNPFALCRS